jgi:hypothetical protein
MLGYRQAATFITYTVATNSPTSIYSMTLGVGNWIVNGNLKMPASSTSAGLSISQTNNLSDDNCATFISTSSVNGFIFNVSKVINITSGTQTWYLIAYNIIGQTAANGAFDAIRVG